MTSTSDLASQNKSSNKSVLVFTFYVEKLTLRVHMYRVSNNGGRCQVGEASRGEACSGDPRLAWGTQFGASIYSKYAPPLPSPSSR